MGLRQPLLDLIGLALPLRCPGCGDVVRQLQLPFEHDRGNAAQYGTCLADPPPPASSSVPSRRK